MSEDDRGDTEKVPNETAVCVASGFLRVVSFRPEQDQCTLSECIGVLNSTPLDNDSEVAVTDQVLQLLNRL